MLKLKMFLLLILSVWLLEIILILAFFFDLLYVIAPLFIFIPVVKVDYENIQSNVGRILSIQIICEIFVLTNYKVDSNKILDNVNRSQIIFSIFLVLFAYLVLKG